jgi:hypothetical protein
MRPASRLEQAHEIGVVFPVPGQAQVVVGHCYFFIFIGLALPSATCLRA